MYNTSKIMSVPKQQKLFGFKTLAGIGIKYQDTARYVGEGSARSMANSISKFYERNSRGQFTLKDQGFLVKVPLNGNRKNLKKAEAIAMNKHKGFDLYAICGIFTGPHAGGKVAHLKGSLASTATHEVGHLLGLGHAATYKYTVEKGKTKISLDYYGDKMSIMSAFPSNTLTSPQYYHLGWTRKDEVRIIYEKDMPKGKVVTVELKRLNKDTGHDLVSTVIFARSNDRAAFLSYPTTKENNPCIALHLSSGGSSQLVKRFGKDFYDKYFTGLDIKIIKYDSKKDSITITIEKKDFDINNEVSEGDFDEMDERIDLGEDLESDVDIDGDFLEDDGAEFDKGPVEGPVEPDLDEPDDEPEDDSKEDDKKDPKKDNKKDGKKDDKKKKRFTNLFKKLF